MAPIYEYRGPRCEERFEQLVPLEAEHPAMTCPRCGTHKICKLLLTFASVESNRNRLGETEVSSATLMRSSPKPEQRACEQPSPFIGPHV